MSEKPKTPRTAEAATEMLARYAALNSQLVLIRAARDEVIASANQAADAGALPIVAEMNLVRAALEPWWRKAAPGLTAGKRKSIELGGCTIGSKLGKDTLALAGEDFDAAAVALQACRWGKPYISIKVSVDKSAALKAIDGPHKAKLAELGFSRKPGADAFYITPLAQAGAVDEPRN